MSNGRMDTSKLSKLVNFHPIDSHAGGLALPEVALQWALMAADCLTATGVTLYASEGYRDLETQHYWKVYWTQLGKPGNAATEGTSTHGDALAIDAGSGAGTVGTPVNKWLAANAHKYGFVIPFNFELWHLLYVGNPSIMYPKENGNTLDNYNKTRRFHNNQTGKQAIVNVATGLWYEIPNEAYLNLLTEHFGELPPLEKMAPNRFKWLKQITYSRK